ncbi:hypothetical protein ABTH47_19980, partial [Acinetobacter baumannii]
IGLIKVDGVQVYPLESRASASEDAPTSEETVNAEDESGGPQPTAATPAPVEEPAQAASF